MSGVKKSEMSGAKIAAVMRSNIPKQKATEKFLSEVTKFFAEKYGTVPEVIFN